MNPALGTLPVAEVFGPTVQGEGPAAGRVAWFVRLGGCNLSCGWCDTPYTWDGNRFDLRHEIAHTPVADILQRIPAGALVVLTGGEPLLQQSQPGWHALMGGLVAGGRVVHVETNGTIPPDTTSLATVELFVVSPKLANAGPHRGHQRAALSLQWVSVAAAGTAHLKVVCRDTQDVALAAETAANMGWPRRQVWVMPEGATRAELDARWPLIAAAAARHGINASHRLHVLAWGDERGH